MTAAERNKATYDRLWPTFSDFIRHNPGARHRRLQVHRLLSGLRFSSLLDVGCGNGALLTELAAKHPSVRFAGVDVSETVVADNQHRFPLMSFTCANIETTALPHGFDVVVCSEVIEHLDRPERAFAHIADALVPGGHAIITCPTGPLYATERHFGHVRHPRPDDVAAMAQAAGLVVDELWVWGFPFYALTKWATNVRPAWALQAFGGDKPYGPAQKAVSLGLFALNAFNRHNDPRGVQLFVRLKRP